MFRLSCLVCRSVFPSSVFCPRPLSRASSTLYARTALTIYLYIYRCCCFSFYICYCIFHISLFIYTLFHTRALLQCGIGVEPEWFAESSLCQPYCRGFPSLHPGTPSSIAHSTESFFILRHPLLTIQDPNHVIRIHQVRPNHPRGGTDY